LVVIKRCTLIDSIYKKNLWNLKFEEVTKGPPTMERAR
jgi:hypothetical protein